MLGFLSQDQRLPGSYGCLSPPFPQTNQLPASPLSACSCWTSAAQYAQLIARRVREQHVYCEMVRHDITAARVRELAPQGLILSGGPASVYAEGAPKCDPAIFDLGIPVLGICYGMQLMCQVLGGRSEEQPDAASLAGRIARSILGAKTRPNLFAGRAARDTGLDEPRRSGE